MFCFLKNYHEVIVKYRWRGAGVRGAGGGDVKEIQGLKALGTIWLFDIWRANK